MKRVLNIEWDCGSNESAEVLRSHLLDKYCIESVILKSPNFIVGEMQYEMFRLIAQIDDTDSMLHKIIDGFVTIKPDYPEQVTRNIKLARMIIINGSDIENCLLNKFAILTSDIRAVNLASQTTIAQLIESNNSNSTYLSSVVMPILTKLSTDAGIENMLTPTIH